MGNGSHRALFEDAENIIDVSFSPDGNHFMAIMANH